MRRYNKETKFPVTPDETRSNREFCLFVISSYSKLYTLKVYWALFNGIGHFITHIYNLEIYINVWASTKNLDQGRVLQSPIKLTQD